MFCLINFLRMENYFIERSLYLTIYVLWSVCTYKYLCKVFTTWWTQVVDSLLHAPCSFGSQFHKFPPVSTILNETWAYQELLKYRCLVLAKIFNKNFFNVDHYVLVCQREYYSCSAQEKTWQKHYFIRNFINILSVCTQYLHNLC